MIESQSENNTVLRKYVDLIKKNNFKSDNIIFLVDKKSKINNYKKQLSFEYSEALNIHTYSSFVKKEIIKFFPIVLQSCDWIKNKKISPSFIARNISTYLLNSKIQKMRIKEDYFSDITSTSVSIANSIRKNMLMASKNLIEFENIGEIIWKSKKNRDNLSKKSFDDMDNIIESYIELLMKNSILDESLSIYLYNNYLLPNEEYIALASKNIDYIVVEGFENSSLAEVKFIDTFFSFVKEVFLFENKKYDFSIFKDVNILIDDESELYTELYDKVSNKIVEICSDKLKCANKVITNQNELVNNFNIVSGDQFENKQNIIDENKTFDDSEFVNNKDRVSKKITTKDIVIICPSNIDIFYNRLRENLKKISMLYSNEKIIKYPYANVLFTACCIFCKKTSFINEEEYINFVQVLLEVNHIRAKKIFKETLKKNKNSNEYSKVGNLKNSVEYRQADMSKQEIEYRQADMSRQEIEYRQANISKQEIEYKKADDSKERIEHIQIERLREIFNYIKKFRNSSTTIYEFMTKFYIEYMLNLEFGKENVKFCKQIIFESMDYTDQIHSLEWDKHKTKEEIFIEVYKSVLSNDISKFNVDELIDSDNILICTPSAFVNHKISRPIRILVDLSSNNWTDKIEKELTNKVAFVENFDEKPFTKEMENDYIISDILDLTYEILDGAESIYSFQSEYSINGFVQSSVMSTVFQRIYDKNQK